MGERQAVGLPAAPSASSACAYRQQRAGRGIRQNALFSAAFLWTATDFYLPRTGAAAETATVQYNRSI
jgi:hypothetical protein